MKKEPKKTCKEKDWRKCFDCPFPDCINNNNPMQGELFELDQGERYRGKSHSRPVIQINSVTNEVVREYESIAQACAVNQISTKSIQAVLAGRRKTLHGFIWQYIEVD